MDIALQHPEIVRLRHRNSPFCVRLQVYFQVTISPFTSNDFSLQNIYRTDGLFAVTLLLGSWITKHDLRMSKWKSFWFKAEIVRAKTDQLPKDLPKNQLRRCNKWFYNLSSKSSILRLLFHISYRCRTYVHVQMWWWNQQGVRHRNEKMSIQLWIDRLFCRSFRLQFVLHL